MGNKSEEYIKIQRENKKLKKKLQYQETLVKKAEDQKDKTLNLLYAVKDEIEKSKTVSTREMEVAGNVHLKFLQKEAPLSDEWELAYYFKPMWGVSGDFYDFYEIENNLHGLGIFDVSGHGIASG